MRPLIWSIANSFAVNTNGLVWPAIAHPLIAPAGKRYGHRRVPVFTLLRKFVFKTVTSLGHFYFISSRS
jgi:hypothetical protein